MRGARPLHALPELRADGSQFPQQKPLAVAEVYVLVGLYAQAPQFPQLAPQLPAAFEHGRPQRGGVRIRFQRRLHPGCLGPGIGASLRGGATSRSSGGRDSLSCGRTPQPGRRAPPFSGP
jgi:hypothetical protein